MNIEDVKAGMEFSMIDISSYWVVIEAIDGADALCQSFTCFSGRKEKVKLSRLVDERLFRRIK